MTLHYHGLEKGPRDVVESVEVRPDDVIPFILFKPKQKAVPADSGIVDEQLDIFAGMGVLPCGDAFEGFRLVGDIELHRFTGTAGIFDLLEGAFRSRIIGHIIDDDVVSHGCQLEAYRPSYSAASAGNKCYFH